MCGADPAGGAASQLPKGGLGAVAYKKGDSIGGSSTPSSCSRPARPRLLKSTESTAEEEEESGEEPPGPQKKSRRRTSGPAESIGGAPPAVLARLLELLRLLDGSRRPALRTIDEARAEPSKPCRSDVREHAEPGPRLTPEIDAAVHRRRACASVSREGWK